MAIHSIKPASAELERVRAFAAAQESASGTSVQVPFASAWRELSSSEGFPLLVGVGQLRYEMFTPARQLAVFEWLASATWLDRMPSPGMPGPYALPPGIVGDLRIAFEVHGAITLRPPAASSDRGFWLGPDADFVGPDGRTAPRSGIAFQNLSLQPKVGWTVAAQAIDALLDLAELRFALGWVTSRDIAVERQLLDGEGPFWRLVPALSEAPWALDERTLYLKRLYFYLQIGAEPINSVLHPPRGLGPMRLIPTAVSGRQQLWMVLAATAGVLDVGGNPEHVHRCDYGACGKLFVGDRTKARGNFRFCSPECGKKHWATATTKDRREKAKREQQAR